MKEIRRFTIDTRDISDQGDSRLITIEGDAGSTFNLTVKNDDPKYYNFTTNSFQTTSTKLTWAKIPSSGVYRKVINIPTVTANETYTITLFAEYAFDTRLSHALAQTVGYSSNNYTTLEKTIYQYTDTSVTFSMTSNSKSYDTFPSDIVLSGGRSTVKGNFSKKYYVSWPVTLKDNSFSIIRQPVTNDFEATKTATTNGTGSSSTSMIVTDTSDLSIGMQLKTIQDGTVSLNTNDILPNITAIDEDTKTLTLSNAQTWGTSKTVTFKVSGTRGISGLYSTVFDIKNAQLKIDDVKTTTTSAVNNSTTVPVASTNGITVGSVVHGIGISCSTVNPTVSNINALNLILSDAQTIENGQELTFKENSRSATITFDLEVDSFGSTDFTTTLNLDNILKIS